ncbi:MAG: hypothetical protein LBB76_08525 [Azoarcus sp.]|jgi:hypothetical protein|nr:hypothetical protein [Azoarcus sp.]
MAKSFPSRSYRFIQGRSPGLFLNDSTKKAALKIVTLALVFLFFCQGVLFLVGILFFTNFPVEQMMEALSSVFMTFWEKLGERFLRLDLSVWPLFLLTFLALHAYFKNLAIVVAEKGVTFQGFLFSDIGKHYAWQDFAQIRRVPQSQGEALVFIDRFGRSIQIYFGEPKTPKRQFFSWATSKEKKQNRPVRFFVGEGHVLSLSEAIEAFHGPVTPLEEAEKKKIPALNQDLVIEGRAFCLVIAAACLLLLVLFLGHRMPYFLLDTWQNRACGWVGWLFCGLGFFFAWRCLKQEESREAAWVISVLFAAPLYFLPRPAAPLLSVWLGEARQETFVLQHNCCNQQNWQSAASPDLFFTQEIPCKRQAYKPGVRREFTVYHGMPGFYAIPFAELETLWIKDDQEVNTASQPCCSNDE